jgi:predicted CoA-binding protein
VSKRVAVIGASPDRRKYGNKALRAFQRQGYEVFAVNPNETMVEGLTSYPSVLDIPGEVDMATFYVPPEIGEQVIVEVARKGIREVWLNPGADGAGVIARAKTLGLEPIIACSIIGIGESPSRY